MIKCYINKIKFVILTRKEVKVTMGYLELNLCTDQQIQWPKTCAFCGSEASAWVEANLSKITGLKYYVIAFGWSTQTKSVLYPVCHKHRLLCSFLSEPSKWTLTDIVRYLILIPPGFMFLLWLALLSIEEFTKIDLEPFCFYLPFYLAGFLFLFIIVWRLLSSILMPIKIFDVKEWSLTLYIKNKRFLEEFKKLNNDMVKILNIN